MIGVMSPHLIIAPVLLPVLTAALMLALGEQRRETLAGLNVGSCLVGLALSILLAWSVHHGAAPASPGQTPGSIGTLGIYLPANWPTPFGIVLVLDRLSSAMLLLTSVMATAALIFAVARWDRIGVHFHPLFQIQLMGLNGAFLTGDLFNLFVFFEVLLAASYGLLLHGPGRQRVGAGLHYIAINLVASSFFLVGAAMLYGVTGTLNMADLAVRIPEVAAQDQAMLHAGVAILGMAFLTKAAVWPMGFWLVPAYSAAGAPVAALFSIMTKVGIYAILRLWSLGFSGEEGTLRWGADWLVAGGLATVAFGLLGLLQARQLGRVTGFGVMVTSGTLLAAIGFNQPTVTGGALYYLLSSTMAAGAMFLLIELIDRSRLLESEFPNPDDADPVPFFLDEIEPPRDTNLDEQQEALTGRVIPASTAFLGFSFLACTLLLTGTPPLSGFIGKFMMLSGLLSTEEAGSALQEPVSTAAWVMLALVIMSGFAALVALSRTGIRMFWTPRDRPAAQLKVLECLPIGLLLTLCLLISFRAEPLARYLQAAASELKDPHGYVQAVQGVRPLPPPSVTRRILRQGIPLLKDDGEDTP
ncbi:monovalent cation/H+ antiporter subunit D [Lautropia mirabilis]|jgi:putative monovalent cation/H+ antiporter subunit D|uniref:NADH-ubiquinone/plastoquinone (Complex I) family protein n=1 Tax=Lautropia mirabilis ATCC 51599 TaxID=887898 RepID=E7RVR6_9BURK|nr:monovalent cation/H+ antiporter subunit D [Lautropia mirabilis]EFV95399.1 NADH-ubiquinone/plastoquinone (complex I) family protein [Lautropia mirabilis ATCC 51599]VEH02338.1 Multiple resistance and pH homeostasis protein D [Lautropia mirabilis]